MTTEFPLQQYKVKSTQGRWILAATILVSGMVALLGRSVSIALPTIQSAFNTNIAGIQWVISSYALVIAALILICGLLGDHFGRKRILNLGIVIFVFGCLLSTFAQTIAQLIFFQAVIGLGAVLMLPACLSIINACFIETEKGWAIGLWAGFSGAFGVAGFLIGGWILQIIGWQLIYLINIPIGVIALFITLRFVPETNNPDARGIDWVGTFWLAVGLFGLSYGLIIGPIVGWTDYVTLTSLIVGVLGTLLFLFSQIRSKHPLIPLSIFRDRLVAGANAVTFFLYFSLTGVYVFLVIYFQQLHGYSPLQAGAAMLPPSLLVTLFASKFGSLADRIGPRLPLIVGPTLSAIGIALLTLPGANANYFTQFLPALIIFGTGMIIFVAPITKAALAVDSKYSGVASGVNNAVARISGLMAIAILGALMATVFKSSLNTTLSHAKLTKEQQMQILDQADKVGGVEIPGTFDNTAAVEARQAIQESFVDAFRWAMGVCAALASLSALVSVIIIRNPKGKQKHARNTGM